MSEQTEVIRSRIWEEEPEADNPFAAAACYCSGYDVYGDLLGKAGWIEYLYLLFGRERPSAAQTKLLEGLAVALANPGPRDPSVHAAMSAGVGGSTYASCLMAALAVGAGQYGGAHEVAIAVAYWERCGTDLQAWKDLLANPPLTGRAEVWLPMEHPPGFDPHGASCPRPVRQMLAYLSQYSRGPLRWLSDNRAELEAAAGCPLAMTGVGAAALFDLGLDKRQGEMLYLLLRLPGAAVHALEQEEYGWQRFPFFSGKVIVEDDPGPKPLTDSEISP